MLTGSVDFFRVGFKIKQSMKDEELYKDRDSQIAAIEHTFVKAAEPVSLSLPSGS